MFDAVALIVVCIFAVLHIMRVFWHAYCIVQSVFYFNDDYNNTFGLSAFLFGVMLCAIHRRTTIQGVSTAGYVGMERLCNDFEMG